jgi:predicted DCC family thiol-disulfide oxidoreductase YuxK
MGVAGLMARWDCDGSNGEPMPSRQTDGGLYTRVTPTFRIYHAVNCGVCPVCHEVKRLLKSGRLPKHTRYVSWKEQQAMTARESR